MVDWLGKIKALQFVPFIQHAVKARGAGSQWNWPSWRSRSWVWGNLIGGHVGKWKKEGKPWPDWRDHYCWDFLLHNLQRSENQGHWREDVYLTEIPRLGKGILGYSLWVEEAGEKLRNLTIVWSRHKRFIIQQNSSKSVQDLVPELYQKISGLSENYDIIQIMKYLYAFLSKISDHCDHNLRRHLNWKWLPAK